MLAASRLLHNSVSCGYLTSDTNKRCVQLTMRIRTIQHLRWNETRQ
jgi:hypothetical protein